MSVRWLRFVVGIVVLAAPLHAGGGWAERGREASLVVVGECVAAESRWEGGAIWTHSTVHVRDVVRGRPSGEVEVRQRGGIVDGIGQKVSHVQLLEPGVSYLLLMAPAERDTWAPVPHGVAPVRVDARGREHVGDDALDAVKAALGAPE